MKIYNQLTVICYHYLRDPNRYKYPGIHPLSTDEFIQQIKSIKKRNTILTPDQVEKFILYGDKIPDSSVFITFDDGLIDHKWACEMVLDPIGIKAAFFIATRPLLDQKALVVNKLQFCRSRMEGKSFANKLKSSLKDAGIDEAFKSPAIISKAKIAFPFDSEEDRLLKFVVNTFLPHDILEEFLDKELLGFGVEEEVVISDLYMTDSDIRTLHNNGHVIGAHTHEHRPLSNQDSEPELDYDLTISTNYLRQLTGRDDLWFAYPYGRKWAMPEDPHRLCSKYRYSLAFTLEKGSISPCDSKHLLKRITPSQAKDMGLH